MTDNNVINFPQVGFTLPPAHTPPTPVAPPLPAAPPAVPGPSAGSAPTGRRSPLTALTSLPDPGILQPAIPAQTTPAPTPGGVPDTFRAEPAGDLLGPRLGALGMAATLAVAVAALRSTHTVLSTWWENRQAKQAETSKLREARLKHQLAMQHIGDKAAQQRAKTNRAPSSSEFGRKALGNRSSGGGTGGGKGSGRPGKGTGSSSGSGASTGPGSKKRSNGSTGPGSSNGSRLNGVGKGGAGRGPGLKNRKDTHGPLRTNQRAGGGLKKAKPNTSDTSDGKRTRTPRKNDRTTLPQALAKDTGKNAARRLKKRRKDLDNPALWNTDKTAKQRGKKHPGKNLATTRKADGNTNGPKTPKTTQDPKNNKKTQRTTLAGAMSGNASKAARKRLKKRRRTTTPPIWSAPRNRGRNAGKPQSPRNGKANEGVTKTSFKTRGQRTWDKARAYTRKKATRDGRFDGTTPGPQPGPHTPPPGAGQQGGPRRGGRRSPFENAGQATTATEWTVERADHAGDQAKTWTPDALTRGTAALEAAPTPHTERPGTTRPKEPHPMPPSNSPARPDPRILDAKTQAAQTGQTVTAGARHMDAQHETEITLDDALDEYGAFTADGFKTHDQCAKLAHRATKLRDVLALFADDLATNHNLIGALFTSAMARMSESMDLVARMAEEMQVSSIQAAEMAEAADNDLGDAYRPYTQATADAGLTTPSAPIHNQN